MAIKISPLSLACIIVTFLVLLAPSTTNARKFQIFSNPDSLRACNVERIYQLGDSISDTGNLVIENPVIGFHFGRLPYGETLGNATGRCSNGLLIIDYIALSAGLPPLNPYKKTGADFSNGVNFAVAGATVLSSEASISHGFPPNPATNSSLGVQLGWMSSFFNSTCGSKEACRKALKNSLFVVGEVGGNDFNFALLANKTVEEMEGLIPDVVQGSIDAVREVIDFGATKVIVPGNFPIGCHPVYLSLFRANDSSAFDQYNCLKDLNELARVYNRHLRRSLHQLKKEFPRVSIVYADYYHAFLSLLRDAGELGFEETRKACCGSGGGKYNFSMDKICGTPGVTEACPNPDNHVSWDGIHMTQQAYKLMSQYVIKSILPRLKCSA